MPNLYKLVVTYLFAIRVNPTCVGFVWFYRLSRVMAVLGRIHLTHEIPRGR
jgi:hypothetical protein